MTIAAADIKRNKNGFYLHPELPDWDEGNQGKEMDAWLASHGMTLHFESMQKDDEELSEAWADGKTNNCSAWVPKCPAEGAVLLSIHDTEDWGPLAMYAVPASAETEEN